MPKLTPNQQAYKKQVQRIKNFYKRAEKRGYRFNTKLDLDMPKRVTKKALKQITDIKPKELYSNAQYLDSDTGKVVTGVEGRVIERRKAYYKGREKQMASPYDYEYDYETQYSPPNIVDDVLANISDIFNEIEGYSYKDSWSAEFRVIKENDKNILVNMINGAIAELGRYTVALNIEANSHELKRNIDAILYGESGNKKDGVQPNLMEVHRILYNRTPTLDEGAEYLENHEMWGATLTDTFNEYDYESLEE